MKKENTDLFLMNFELYGDEQNSLWDTYDKMENWLGIDIQVSILSRSMNDDVPKLYKEIFERQNTLDYEWEKYAATNLIDDLKLEWEKEDINIEFIIDELIVTTITFCFYSEGDFCIYYRPKTINCEHGIILLGDKDGNLLKTHIE